MKTFPILFYTGSFCERMNRGRQEEMKQKKRMIYEKKKELLYGEMKIIDLTHTITEDVTVYPGTETPKLLPAVIPV